MTRHKVAGCSMGLKSIVGKTRDMPLCKAWGVWTNCRSLSAALTGSHVRCSGAHSSIAVGGADTEHSGSYPDDFAGLVHHAITCNVDDVATLVASQRWRTSLESHTFTHEGGAACPDNQPESTSAGAGTDGSRRCLKPASLSRLDSGAARQRSTVEPCSVVSACLKEHVVARNKCAVSCTSRLSRPTLEQENANNNKHRGSKSGFAPRRTTSKIQALVGVRSSKAKGCNGGGPSPRSAPSCRPRWDACQNYDW